MYILKIPTVTCFICNNSHFILYHTFYIDFGYDFFVKFEISYYFLQLYFSTLFLLLYSTMMLKHVIVDVL
jgi:hypothetical protein